MSTTDSYNTVDDTISELKSKYFAPSPDPVDVQFGAMSHPGKVRSNNEDHFLVVRRQRSREAPRTHDREQRKHRKRPPSAANRAEDGHRPDPPTREELMEKAKDADVDGGHGSLASLAGFGLQASGFSS